MIRHDVGAGRAVAMVTKAVELANAHGWYEYYNHKESEVPRADKPDF